MNLANAFTLLRIVFIPFIWSAWLHGHPLWASAIALVAFSTDFFDGKIARRLNQVTFLGSLLDPIADKILVLALLSLLTLAGIFPVWFFVIVALRHVSQLWAIPMFLWIRPVPFKVRPKLVPKLATAYSFALLAVGMILGVSGIEKWLGVSIWTLALGVAALMEAWILVTYWPRFFAILQRRQDTFE